MRVVRTIMIVLALGGSNLEAEPESAPESAAAFALQVAYFTANGGWWTAERPVADTANPFTHYFYKAVPLTTGVGMMVSIGGTARDGAFYRFWDVLAYRDPVRGTIEHVQVGPYGSGRGGEKIIDSVTSEVIVDIIQVQGAPFTFRDVTRRVNDSTMSSTTYMKDSTGSWREHEIHTWRRCAEPAGATQ